jgi:hypothetical protein
MQTSLKLLSFLPEVEPDWTTGRFHADDAVSLRLVCQLPDLIVALAALGQ